MSSDKELELLRDFVETAKQYMECENHPLFLNMYWERLVEARIKLDRGLELLKAPDCDWYD